MKFMEQEFSKGKKMVTKWKGNRYASHKSCWTFPEKLGIQHFGSQIKEELHGEKVPGAERSPSEILTCWQRQVLQ